MKITFLVLLLPLLAFVGCSTSQPAKTADNATKKPGQAKPAKDTPETVLVTYHVKPGMELIFQSLLAKAWDTYRKEHLVLSEPHVIVRQPDPNATSTYVEIFSWVNHAAPAKASPNVQQIWSQENGLCEPRGGQQPLGGGEVDLILPVHK